MIHPFWSALLSLGLSLIVRSNILDLLVPKSLETVAWKQRQWFDWNGLPICAVSVEGLVEMKRAAARDLDLIDLKNLGFDSNEK